MVKISRFVNDMGSNSSVFRVSFNENGSKYIAGFKEGGVAGGTKNYEKLDNLPTINGIEIRGDKISADYLLADKNHKHNYNDIIDAPINISDFINDEGFITIESVKDCIRFADLIQEINGDSTEEQVPSAKAVLDLVINIINEYNFAGASSPGGPALSAEKLVHKLTIGEHVYDGSEDVNIDVYDGELSDGDYTELASYVQQLQKYNTSLSNNTNNQSELLEVNIKQMTLGNNVQNMQLLEDSTNQMQLNINSDKYNMTIV